MHELPHETTLRDFAETDAEAVLRINADNVPEVGPMDADKLAYFARAAWWFPVVEHQGQVQGFAILLTEGAEYPSPNYRWFCARHERFSYVDRIAIAPPARSLGVGRSIYGQAVAKAIEERRLPLCAEVNTVPINEPSLRFHDRFGFVEAGRERPYGDEQEVAMLECRPG